RPQFPDRVLDHLGRCFVLGGVKLAEQAVEQVLGHLLIVRHRRGRRRHVGLGRRLGSRRQGWLLGKRDRRQHHDEGGQKGWSQGLGHLVEIGSPNASKKQRPRNCEGIVVTVV